MTFARLKAEPHPREFTKTPQCSVPVPPPTHNKLWRAQRYGKRGTDPTLCQRDSAYLIDGKPYCRCHAAEVALRKWSRGELAEANRDAT